MIALLPRPSLWGQQRGEAGGAAMRRVSCLTRSRGGDRRCLPQSLLPLQGVCLQEEGRAWARPLAPCEFL